MFDDGAVTYFQFDSRNAAPAVFVIGVDGKEEMANTRVSGDYTVADFIAETFILRYGKTQAEVKEQGVEQTSEGEARTLATAEPRLTWRAIQHLQPPPRTGLDPTFDVDAPPRVAQSTSLWPIVFGLVGALGRYRLPAARREPRHNGDGASCKRTISRDGGSATACRSDGRAARR